VLYTLLKVSFDIMRMANDDIWRAAVLRARSDAVIRHMIALFSVSGEI